MLKERRDGWRFCTPKTTQGHLGWTYFSLLLIDCAVRRCVHLSRIFFPKIWSSYFPYRLKKLKAFSSHRLEQLTEQYVDDFTKAEDDGVCRVPPNRT